MLNPLLHHPLVTSTQVGIIGGADGPTVTFVTTRILWPELIAVAAGALVAVGGVLLVIWLRRRKKGREK